MSQGKIIKSFGDKYLHELQSMGTTSTVSWERLKPFLEKAVGVRETEFIEGISADDFGIKVIIGRKPEAGKK